MVTADANAVVDVVGEGARETKVEEEEVVTALAAAETAEEAVEKTAVAAVGRSDAAAKSESGALTRSDIVKGVVCFSCLE